MTIASFDDTRMDNLRALYKANSAAAKILDHFAGRQRDRNVTEVDRLEQLLPNVSRAEIIDVFKRLDDLGFGQFLVGRRGAASRFVWTVSLISVGKAATGQGTVEAVVDDDDEARPATPPRTIAHEYRLRPTFTVQISLPEDLSAREASRIADFIRTLPFEG